MKKNKSTIAKRSNHRNSDDTEDMKPQLGNVKDELFLISFVVLCSGLVFTDAYFQRFGFRYQLLNISSLHIIYKGLTMVISSPLMLIPYSFTVVLLMFEVYAIKKNIKYFLALRSPITYAFLIIILLLIFPLAIRAGVQHAMIDIQKETSTLPKVRRLETEGFSIKAPVDNYLLFMIDSDFVTVFVPLEENEKDAFPIIKRIPKKEIELLETIM